MIRRLVVLLFVSLAIASSDAGVRASLGLGGPAPSPGKPRITLTDVGGGSAGDEEPPSKEEDPGDPREVCSFRDIDASYEVTWSQDAFVLSELTLARLPRCKVTGVNIALYDMQGEDLWSDAFVLRHTKETFPIEGKPPVDSVNGLRLSIVDGADPIPVPGLCASRLFPRAQIVTPSNFDNVFVGTPEPDKVHGTWRRDLILGHAGDDTLIGFTISGTMDDFGDTLDRATGEASVAGLLGGDCIAGADGNDRINGHIGNDVILGDVGDDQIWGGLGHDVIDGGPGYDVCYGGTLEGGSALTEPVWRDEFVNCEVVR